MKLIDEIRFHTASRFGDTLGIGNYMVSKF